MATPVYHVGYIEGVGVFLQPIAPKWYAVLNTASGQYVVRKEDEKKKKETFAGPFKTDYLAQAACDTLIKTATVAAK